RDRRRRADRSMPPRRADAAHTRHPSGTAPCLAPARDARPAGDLADPGRAGRPGDARGAAPSAALGRAVEPLPRVQRAAAAGRSRRPAGEGPTLCIADPAALLRLPLVRADLLEGHARAPNEGAGGAALGRTAQVSATCGP